MAAEQFKDQGSQPSDPGVQGVLQELMQREPIFHRPELGTTRADFVQMLDPGFWEVGASGRRYSREYVIEGVLLRYSDPNYRGIHSPPENSWELTDFHCREVGSDTYLFSYTLFQGERVSRRSTIWRKTNGNWRVMFHQGTLVSTE